MAIQFPNSPGIGSVFTDTDAGFSYEWTGVVWKSFTPAASSNVRELDDISSSFNNSTTTFNLTIGGVAYQPRSAAMLQISLGGVIQEPSTDYTVSTSTITFTTAPNAGLDFFGVVRGTAVAIDYANNGNVQTKQEFTATLGQTSFTVTGGYTQGYVDVFRNGIRLGSDDFTDTSGTAIVLTVPAQADDLIEVVKYNVASIVVSQGEFTNINVSGIVTASSFEGDGSSLTGIDATALKDSGGNVKAQANPGGVVITGVTTATTFVGNLTGNVTGNTSGTAGGLTGTPNITVGSVTAASGSFSGNVSIGGTLTYQDVTNIDAVGIITAQQGIQVLANGLTVTGVSTFNDNIDLQDDDKILIGTGDDLEIYHDGTDNIIKSALGALKIQAAGSNSYTVHISARTDKETIKCYNNTNAPYVELYYDNSKKLETSSGGITVTGNLLPEANGTRDLGATGTRWANLYTSDIDLSNEAKGGNEVDGTWGSYTIQEGENDLFLINRRTGKTFKFVLEEIN